MLFQTKANQALREIHGYLTINKRHTNLQFKIQDSYYTPQIKHSTGSLDHKANASCQVQKVKFMKKKKKMMTCAEAKLGR